MRKEIYMDNASTTKLDPAVLDEMMPYLSGRYGNPSSTHSLGSEAKGAMENARGRLARALNASPDEIIFTSGGTEADNLAIFGSAHQAGKGHIITSAIEHSAVLNPCRHLERAGFSATYVPVTPEGLVTTESVEGAIRPDTFLISIMHANNEIGTIQPIREIAKVAGERNVLFHTDAVQSFGKLDTDVRKLGVSMMSLSSHKIHGPKGVGALYVRKGTVLSPLLYGGGHERGIRSGTENVPGIVGFGAAAERARSKTGEYSRVKQLRDRLMDGLLKIEDTVLNGAREPRLQNNVNITFKFIEGEGLVLLLQQEGIMASTASACSSHSLKPSHVLLAIGKSPEDAHGALRLSLSEYNTASDVERVLEVLPKAVKSLRSMSPFRTESDVKGFSERHATEDEHVH